MSKHTPGPWVVSPQSDPAIENDAQRIIRAEDTHIAPLARVFTLDCANSLSELDANAALIAASPELLEAAKLCHAFLLSLPMDKQPDSDLRDISLSGHLREVIAKAEGSA